VIKGTLTRERILKKGMLYARRFGLLSVNIGEISKTACLSRIGVISHFADNEDMQIAILKYTEDLFIQIVLKKYYTENPLDNLHNLKRRWLNWTDELGLDTDYSCPLIKAVVEYKNRESSLIKEHMQDQQQRLLNAGVIQ
jgi:AcrR family transcriptional regulator